MALDTLAYVEHLTAAGVDAKQAKAHAKAMVDHILPQAATRADLDAAIHTLTLRMYGAVLAAAGLVLAILKLSH
jgi:hypothetical protein